MERAFVKKVSFQLPQGASFQAKELSESEGLSLIHGFFGALGVHMPPPMMRMHVSTSLSDEELAAAVEEMQHIPPQVSCISEAHPHSVPTPMIPSRHLAVAKETPSETVKPPLDSTKEDSEREQSSTEVIPEVRPQVNRCGYVGSDSQLSMTIGDRLGVSADAISFDDLDKMNAEYHSTGIKFKIIEGALEKTYRCIVSCSATGCKRVTRAYVLPGSAYVGCYTCGSKYVVEPAVPGGQPFERDKAGHFFAARKRYTMFHPQRSEDVSPQE